MPAPKSFALRHIINVPVGAEVEVISFYQAKTSLWDGAITGHEAEVQANEAVVRDLGTGVVFGAPWHFHGFDLNPKLAVAETFRGRVVACHLRSGAGADNRFIIETWLAVEPSSGDPYR
jgi:hypothetical protein